MTIRVLVLTKYDDMAPSSRVRFQQYFANLTAQGLELDCKPLLDNHYIRSFYQGRSVSFCYLLRCYMQRVKVYMSCQKYDVIWLEAELFPFLPACIENLFYRFLKAPVVVNYDDAIFHRYDLNHSIITRVLLKNKIAEVMRHAHTVIVGNGYLEHYAKQAGARNVLRIPTVVNTELYQVSLVTKHRLPIRIGWIGTPSTFKFLQPLFPVFRKLATIYEIKVCVMGADEFSIPEVITECVTWSVATEIPFLQSLDIGIMPLNDTPWERGKCGYKLIQYMACGKPVIGTPLEINAEIIEDGVNGFWANTEEEWLDAFLKLCKTPELRLKMGQMGRHKAEAYYSLKATAPLIFNALTKAAQLKLA